MSRHRSNGHVQREIAEGEDTKVIRHALNELEKTGEKVEELGHKAEDLAESTKRVTETIKKSRSLPPVTK